jgi:hypothetical protein
MIAHVNRELTPTRGVLLVDSGVLKYLQRKSQPDALRRHH